MWSCETWVPNVPLRISALGPLRLSVGDRIVPRGEWRLRPLQVFLLLVTRRFEFVERDEVIETFWPREKRSEAAHNLAQTIHLIRRLLQPDHPSWKQSGYIITLHDSIRLEPGKGFTYDVIRFEDGLIDARYRVDDPSMSEEEMERIIHSLQTTLAIYRGDFLEEFRSDDFTKNERVKLREKWMRGATRLMNLLAAAKRRNELIEFSRVAIDRDRCSEEFTRLLMEAHLARGNANAALTAYKAYAKAIREEDDRNPATRIESLRARAIGVETGTKPRNN